MICLVKKTKNASTFQFCYHTNVAGFILSFWALSFAFCANLLVVMVKLPFVLQTLFWVGRGTFLFTCLHANLFTRDESLHYLGKRRLMGISFVAMTRNRLMF